MEGENGSERENKCKLTPRYEKTPGSRVPREEKPAADVVGVVGGGNCCCDISVQ